MSKLPNTLLQDWQVVIVEDEPDNMDVASYILEFYGATVHCATDGSEGLQVIQTVKPDFVISDLSMPVMDGWELITRLKKNVATTNIPIIALTAHAMAGDRERAMAAGFHNYLSKPLTPETFIDQLVRLLLDIPNLSDRLKV
jgi:two-component system cell cycle response regulator DivK